MKEDVQESPATMRKDRVNGEAAQRQGEAENNTQETVAPVKWHQLRKVMRKIRDGKFFPRQFFIDNWGVLLTIVTLLLASIAHRNMYLIQFNKINKLEEELTNRRTDRILLEYEYANVTRPHEIERAVLNYGLPLQPVPEPNDEITLNDE